MSANHWSREERIFEFCINHARQIIAELRTSGGEHYEDIEDLDGLIETWAYLANVAEEARRSEERKTKAEAK